MPRGDNPKSRANLKPWKPGQSGNPKGINRKRPITDEYFARANEVIPDRLRLEINKKIGKDLIPPGITWSQANSLRQFIEAVIRGETKAAKEIREAVEGKSPQRLEITGPEKKEITIRVIYGDQKA